MIALHKYFAQLSQGSSELFWLKFSIVHCPLSVVVVILLVNFSHFYLLLHWTNFNQTWHKASFVARDSSLFKWRVHPFPRGDNYQIAKIHWRNLITSFSRTTEPILTKLGTMHPWVKGIEVCSNRGPCLFQGEIITI